MPYSPCLLLLQISWGDPHPSLHVELTTAADGQVKLLDSLNLDLTSVLGQACAGLQGHRGIDRALGREATLPQSSDNTPASCMSPGPCAPLQGSSAQPRAPCALPGPSQPGKLLPSGFPAPALRHPLAAAQDRRHLTITAT